MKKIITAALALLIILPSFALAKGAEAVNISRFSWHHVAEDMPDEWYGTEQAAALADTVLAAQISCGGWFKNLPYHKMELSHRRELARAKRIGSAIFDNDATFTEINFLAKVYAHRPEQRFAEGFRRALECVFNAQYDNGGWPMFWPLSEECLQSYGVIDPVSGKKYIGHITFNDNATVNLLLLMREIYLRNPLYAPLTDESDAERARKAFYDGIQCILDCQIRGTYEQYEFGRSKNGGVIVGDRRTGDGELTVWCAQHDAETLEPAQARAYEYPSYCGGESAGILKLLMSIKPTDIPEDRPEMWEAIKTSVVAAVKWFDAHRIEGKRFVNKVVDGERDRELIDAPGERNLWARFYELTTCRPIFGMYDFVRLYDVREVSPKRRSGYAWYTDALEQVFKIYPEWHKKYIDK